jgi:hypothetical protein
VYLISFSNYHQQQQLNSPEGAFASSIVFHHFLSVRGSPFPNTSVCQVIITQSSHHAGNSPELKHLL